MFEVELFGYLFFEDMFFNFFLKLDKQYLKSPVAYTTTVQKCAISPKSTRKYKKAIFYVFQVLKYLFRE